LTVATSPSKSPRGSSLALIDRYVLRLTLWPMLGCLAVTVISLLLERTLRLLDMLSQSNSRFSSVIALTGDLIPHYLGLALPVAFFVALFIVITRLDDGSEVEAFLASGVPLTRLAAPYVTLGLVLMAFSLVIFGYAQPYSRYAYRAVLYAAVNAGWDGKLDGGAFINNGGTNMTADRASLEGRELRNVFIRRPGASGGEEVITARTAALVTQPDGKTVTLVLRDGARMSESRTGSFDTLKFDTFIMQNELAGATALLRARGGDERELTLNELAGHASARTSGIPRQTLMAELYGRLARSMVLPFLPLIAFPLGLASKRQRRTAGLLLAGGLFLAFQHGLQFGQGLAAKGRVPAELGVGVPFFLFTGFCLWMFIGSRKRPGETPISGFVQGFGDGLEQVVGLFHKRRAVP